MTAPSPAAFMSYVHADDRRGDVTSFRERLADEIGAHLGIEFRIFQDRADIEWGQQWRQRIEQALDAATLLFPIITPRFFQSEPCRDELRHFVDRERALDRRDLILPIYYIDHPPINGPTHATADELLREVADHQYIDWRDLRFEPLTSPQIQRRLAQLAVQVRAALQRGHSDSAATAGGLGAAPATSGDLIGVAEASPGVSGQVAPGPAPKTEPPTRVVDQLHRGDHTTIEQAIRAAAPGDLILVRPGLYLESLVIDKPLEIVGVGEPGEVVVRSREKGVLLFKTTMGRVTNLTLKQEAGDDRYAVDISQGRLELEDCDISSQSLACVAIRGGADPRVRRNRIHDGRRGGVFIYDNGQGLLEDNDIFGNALSGVEIKTGANPTLWRNHIHDGRSSGIYVQENGQGLLEDNDIFGNALVGVAIKTGANPIVRRNRIHDGRQGGVLVYENGQGLLEDNDIFGNALVGVEIREAANPTLRRNRIHDGLKGGIYVHKDGEGLLEDNDIFGNAMSEVEIQAAANPTLRRNRIHDGKSSGVYVHENGQGLLEDNDIFGNALGGVSISEAANPIFRRNRIRDGKADGVLVYENGQGLLEDNDIFGNALAGVEIRTGGTPTLRHNRITKNGYEAVWVHDGGGGTVEDNDLRGNKRGAWDVARDSQANLERTRNRE